MNKIFKVVKNANGNQVVTSELAKSQGKKGVLSKLIAMTVLTMGSSLAFATPVSIQGQATSENAVSVGSESFATSVDGVATGKGSVATGQGFNRTEFEAKKKEAQAALDAVNQKQDELNNKKNEQDANNAAIDSLGKQINDLTQKQKDIAKKIAERDKLNNRKDTLTPDLAQAKDALTKAEEDLKAVQDATGKNILANFTDMINSLDKSVLSSSNPSEENRNVLARELQGKVTKAVPEIIEAKPEYQQLPTYRKIVDGYINRKASYNGSYEYLANSTGDVLKSLIDTNSLYNKQYFTSNLDQSDYAVVNDDFRVLTTKSVKDNVAISGDGKNFIFSKGDFSMFNHYVRAGSYKTGDSYIDKNGVLKYYLKTVNEIIKYTNNTLSNVLNELNLSSGEKEKILNFQILKDESSKKLKQENKGYIINHSTGVGFIDDNINLIKDFSEGINKYNTAAQNHNNNNPFAVNFGVKTTDGRIISSYMNDNVFNILSKLNDLTVSNQNLISSNEIDTFKRKLIDYDNFYNSIDWNDQDAAINLTDFKTSLDKIRGYYNKVENVLNLYQEIINERKKDNADQKLIDKKTAQMLDLQGQIFNGLNDPTNFYQGIKLTYTPKATEYLNYGKAEADAKIARINNELKLYNDKEELIVEVTNKAKELQKNYDDKKAEVDSKQKELDKLNDQIDRLALTEDEKATDDTKRQKQKELEDANNKKTQLEDEIAKGNEELDRLKGELANSSLKELGLHSQAHGSNAFASGDDSIAIGTNTTVTSKDGITIGRDSNVTGTQSIALGAENTVSGNKSIAIGVGHNVSGNHSSTIGDPNTITGDNVFVAGNNNTVNSNDVMVLGNNITVGKGFNGAVVLGSDSAPSSATPTTNIKIKEKTYNFAGITPTSTVSVGAVGAERQITNVAAGQISETSTDAVNGSQLYALASAINSISDDITDEIAEQLDNVKPVKVEAGNNIKVAKTTDAQTGEITYTVSADAVPTTLTAGGDNVSLTETTNPTTGAKEYTLSVKSAKVEAGKNVTVDSKVDGDVTTYTVNAEKSTVKAGTGTKVTSTTDNGTTDYTVGLADDVMNKINQTTDFVAGDNIKLEKNVDASGNVTYNLSAIIPAQIATELTAGKNVILEEKTDAQGNKTYTVNVDKTTVSGSDSIKVTQGEKDANGVIDYKVELSESAKAQLAKEESVVAGSTNVVVKQDKTNSTGGKEFVVDIAKSLEVDSVKAGDTTINDNGVTINNGPSITKSGINANNTKVTNVKEGDVSATSKDAVNGSQLYQTNVNVTKNATDIAKNATDIAKNTGDIAKNATDIANTAKDVAENKANIAKGFNTTTDDGKVVNYQLGDTIKITGDNNNIATQTTADGKVRVKLADNLNVNSVTVKNGPSLSATGIDAGSKVIKNVADGQIAKDSKDAVNGGQLYDVASALNNKINNVDDSLAITNKNVGVLNDRVNNLDRKVDGLSNRVEHINKQRKAGTAAALATAGLPQPHREGQSGFVAGVGQYQGQTGLAVGWSRISDNGKWIIRLSANANTQKEVGGQVGVGYFY